jgi:hypothetical protein
LGSLFPEEEEGEVRVAEALAAAEEAPAAEEAVGAAAEEEVL